MARSFRWLSKWPLPVAACMFLLGCDVSTLNSLFGTASAGVPHYTGYVWGAVEDRYGRPLPGAKVSDGASVFYSSDGIQQDFTSDVPNAAGSTAAFLDRGEFFFIRAAAGGIRNITATYDSTSSINTVQIFVPPSSGQTIADRSQQYVTGGTKPASASVPLVINTGGPLDSSVKDVLDLPTANFNTLIATGSVSGTSLSNIVYTTNVSSITGSVATITAKAPPGSSGSTLAGYAITVTSNTTGATASLGTQAQPLQLTPLLAGPGSAIVSGPSVNVQVDLSQVNNLSIVQAPGTYRLAVEFYDQSGNPVLMRSGINATTQADNVVPMIVNFTYRYGQ